MDSPFLSIVLAGRNDNYGGDFKERLERCISWTHQQLISYKIKAELIFVNYNPLPQPPVESFIQWPVSRNNVTVKILTIPPAVHHNLLNDGTRKNVPLLEYVAKNAGIRRAKGEYILCMNPDILLPETFFASVQELRKMHFYRANRLDFTGFLNQQPGGFIKLFLKGHTYTYTHHNYFNYNALRFKNYFLCKWKYNSVKFQNFFERRGWNVYFHNAEYLYHCNVSGDFMLMHRDNWNKLNGYNEVSYMSLHIDALMIIQASMLGLAEKVLSQPIYHKEHARRYDSNQENPEYRAAYLFFQQQAQKMLAENKPVIYNDENWGLSKIDIADKIIV